MDITRAALIGVIITVAITKYHLTVAPVIGSILAIEKGHIGL